MAKNGFVLPITLMVVAAMIVLTAAVVISLSNVTMKNRTTIEAMIERTRSMNALQFGLSVIASKARGTGGFDFSYGDTPPSWITDFFNWLTHGSDGEYWQNAISQIDTSKCFYISQNETLRDFYNSLRDYIGPGAEVIALPFKSYNTLSMVVANVGHRYSYAVVSTYILNRYAYFTQSEYNPYYGTIWFTTGDVIDGPLRSNDQIHIHGSPVFKGSVEVYDDPTEPGTGVVYYSDDDSPIFYDPASPRLLTDEDRQRFNMELLKNQYEGSLETMVAPPDEAVTSSQPIGLDINLPSNLMLVLEFKSAPGSGQDHWLKVYTLNRYYYPNRMNRASPLFQLKPNPDGTWHLVVTGNNARSLIGLDKGSEYDFHFNGVVKSNRDIAIDNRDNSGKPTYVDGQYTVYSEDDVFIHTHIIYEGYRDLLDTMAASEGIHGGNNMDELQFTDEYNELLKDATCDDFLNIVAKDSIEVMEKKENLKIFGSLYAFEGSFQVANFQWGNPRGQLTIYGSLMQNYRGPVGTFDPYTGEISSGYSKNYVYDWRILGGLGAVVNGTPSAQGRVLVITMLGVN